LFLRGGVLCGLIWSLGGCQHTDIQLRVRTPGETDMTGTNVRLVIGDEPVCSGGVLYANRTDRDGALTVHTPACGPARLVVDRPGSRTDIRKLNTCEVSRLEVVLSPMPAPPVPSDPCGKVVYEFMQARSKGDVSGARALWLHPDELASDAFGPPSTASPSTDDVDAGTIVGNRCRVRATTLLEHGCGMVWRFELELSGGNWLIRSVETSVAEPSSGPDSHGR
jgi:hypothetical protein